MVHSVEKSLSAGWSSLNHSSQHIRLFAYSIGHDSRATRSNRIQNKARRMTGSPTAISPATLSHTSFIERIKVESARCRLAERVAVNQNTTRPWTFDQDVKGYENQRVPAIGLSLEKIEQFGRSEAIELFNRSPLQASSLNWIAGLTGANGYSLDQTLRDGISTIRLAKALNAPTVVVIAGPRNGHTWNHLNRIVTFSLRELATYAQRLGVDLALMPMGPRYRANWSYIRSLRTALSLVKQVKRQNVGLLVNTAHVYRERGLPSLLAESSAYVKLVRLADCSGSPEHDNDQRWLGEGIVPTNAIAGVLDCCGYSGYYEIDVWSRSLWQSCDFLKLLRSTSDLAFGSHPPPAPHNPLAGSAPSSH